MQHSSKQQARRQLNGTIKGGEPLGCPACVDERQAQGGQHVGLPLRRAGLPGQAQRAAQLAYARADVTEITQHDSGRLVRYRCLVRAGPFRQNGARLGQGFARTRQCQQQQIVRVAQT